MNEIVAQLPVLGLLSSSQGVHSKTLQACIDFSSALLLVACALVALLSTKPPKRSHVLSPKSFIRAVFLVLSILSWVWCISHLGVAQALLLEVACVVGLSAAGDGKRIQFHFIGLSILAGLGILGSSGNALATVLGVASIVSREMFNLFRDGSTIFVGFPISLALSFGSHWTHPTSHRSISVGWTFLSALLWVGPVALAPAYDEKWVEYSMNKRTRTLLALAFAVMFAMADKSLHTVSFFFALVCCVALVVQKKAKNGARSSFLPTTVGASIADVDAFKKASKSFPDGFRLFNKVSLGHAAHFFSEAMSNDDSKKILQFLSLTLSFMFVELFVGLYTGSLGLISDAGHMFFDSAALFIGLFAAYASKWRSDRIYTYGYARYETIAGFINAVFLTFVAVFVLTESLERFSEPPQVKTEGLLLTSVLGLVVNGIGLVFFHEHAHSHEGEGGVHGHSHSSTPPDKPREHHGHRHNGGDHSHDHGHSHGKEPCAHQHSHDNHNEHSHGNSINNGHAQNLADEESHGHSHGGGKGSTNENMHGVYLHVLADALGSVGVIISSFLIQYKGWYIADPVCSFCISVLIFLSVLPLLKSTANTLLLRVPNGLERTFETCIERTRRRPGVVKVSKAHLWRLSKDDLVATVNVVVSTKEAQEHVQSWIVNALRNDVGATEVTVQVVSDGLAKELAT